MKPICYADTRNQDDAWACEQIRAQGYEVHRHTLSFGDFALSSEIRLAIDIKSSSGGIVEIARNVCSKDHNRLKREIFKCVAVHGQICFLVAGNHGITSIADLNNWVSPIYKSDIYKTEYFLNSDGTKIAKADLKDYGKEDYYSKRTLMHKKGELYTKVKGETLAKALATMSEPNHYADGLTVRFSFCSKENAGKKIVEILEWYNKNY